MLLLHRVIIILDIDNSVMVYLDIRSQSVTDNNPPQGDEWRMKVERINYITGASGSPASGKLIHLNLDGKKVKAVLQDTLNDMNTETSLVHYATGAIITDSKTLWKEVVTCDNFKRANGISDKDFEAAALRVWRKIIDKHGIDRVKVVFNSPPQINA